MTPEEQLDGFANRFNGLAAEIRAAHAAAPQERRKHYSSLFNKLRELEAPYLAAHSSMLGLAAELNEERAADFNEKYAALIKDLDAIKTRFEKACEAPAPQAPPKPAAKTPVEQPTQVLEPAPVPVRRPKPRQSFTDRMRPKS